MIRLGLGAAVAGLALLLPFEVFAETLCVAHRGNSSEQLENSMAALRSAVEVGAPVIEFDVQHTRDGVALVMHDSKLERTALSRPGRRCPLDREIAKLDFETIRSSCVLGNGEDIPLLSEALEELSRADVAIFLELKDLPSAFTIELLIRAYRDRPEALRVISFDSKTLELVRSVLPAWFFAGGAKLFHVSGKESHADDRFNGVTVHRPGVEFVDRLQQRGLEVGAWTIDGAAEIASYFAMGIDYITTNRPRLCLEIGK